MKPPPPHIVLPFVLGIVVAWVLHPGGEPSSLRGALWALLELGLVALPFAAALNLLTRERRKDALVAFSAWAGAALVAFVLL